MPTYEYKREDGSVFELAQSINDEPLKSCPTTGQPVKRIISGGGGVIYKGTGWYLTDYKNNTSDPKTEKTSVDSSELKPETSSEKKTSED